MTLYEKAARFWAQFVPVEKQAKFIEVLTQTTEYSETKDLYCDYDPQGLLLSTLHAVDIPCKGFMFSASEIGFPEKTGTRIGRTVLVKHSYGTDYIPITEDEYVK